MYEVKVISEFSAAHKLRGYLGRCENLHGHNWGVEVCVSSKKLNKIGIAVDFRELKSKVESVLETLDHNYLNDIHYFKKVNPTSENIAKFIFDKLKKKRVAVKKVLVWESKSSCATYSE